MAAVLIAGCGREEVKEPETTATGHVREDNSGTTDPEVTEPETAPEAESKELKIKVTSFSFSSEEKSDRDDGYTFPLALQVFQKVELDDGCEADYPELKKGLDAYNEEKETSAERSLAGTMKDVWEDPDFIDYMYSSNEQSENLTLVRADDKVLSFYSDIYSSFNGAHPVTWFSSTCFDTKTGEQLPLCDVVSDIKGLPQLILDNLEPASHDYDFTDEENEEMLPIIEEMVADNRIVWTISDKAMDVYFDPYDLQGYAFGPISATLDYSEYPDLLVDEYRPGTDGMKPLAERVNKLGGEEKALDNEEIEELLEQYADEFTNIEYHSVEAPDWDDPAYDENDPTEIYDMPYELKQIKKEDLMFTDTWANANGYVVPGFYRDSDGRYSEMGYTYEPHNDADNYVLGVNCYWDQALTQGYSFDLSSFLYTPNPGNEFTTMYVRYAMMYEGILYVNLAHRTYSADQPYTAYMLAIDSSTGEVKWRSDYLVANCDNFVIYKDTIICGYGFTREDDYIYILSRYSGKLLKQIKVKTSPDYFILDGDKLVVACYDTAYTYELK